MAKTSSVTAFRTRSKVTKRAPMQRKALPSKRGAAGLEHEFDAPQPATFTAINAISTSTPSAVTATPSLSESSTPSASTGPPETPRNPSYATAINVVDPEVVARFASVMAPAKEYVSIYAPIAASMIPQPTPIIRVPVLPRMILWKIQPSKSVAPAPWVEPIPSSLSSRKRKLTDKATAIKQAKVVKSVPKASTSIPAKKVVSFSSFDDTYQIDADDTVTRSDQRQRKRTARYLDDQEVAPPKRQQAKGGKSAGPTPKNSLVVVQSVSTSPDAEAKALLNPLRPVFCCDTLKASPDYICVPGPISSTLQRGRLCNFLGYMSDFSLKYSVPVASDITWSHDAVYLIQVQVFHKKEPSKNVMKRKNNGWTKAQRGKKLEEYKKVENEKWVQRGLGRFFVECVYERRKKEPDCPFEEVMTTEERVPAFFKKVAEISLVFECPEHGAKYVCDFWARE